MSRTEYPTVTAENYKRWDHITAYEIATAVGIMVEPSDDDEDRILLDQLRRELQYTKQMTAEWEERVRALHLENASSLIQARAQSAREAYARDDARLERLIERGEAKVNGW